MLRNHNLIRLLKSAKSLTAYQRENMGKNCSINVLETTTKPICVVSLTKSIHLTSFVNKSKKKITHDDDTDSDEETEIEFKDERDSKIIKTKVNSLRADLLLKAGLNVARNKIEILFYESKIRVNGKKLPKKSIQLNEGDEIDVVRGFSQSNPSHLIVARVMILSITELDEGSRVVLRRYKNLLIENYKAENAYKSSETSLNH